MVVAANRCARRPYRQGYSGGGFVTQFDVLPTLPAAQRWREQSYPTPIVAALLRRDSHYLLIRRNSAPYEGLWALVGGKWDFGEELATAVIREVKEETGLDSRFVALRGLVNERFIEDDTGAHFLIFLCEVTAVKGTASEQHEGAVAWFTRPEIDNLASQNAIVPSDYAMLAEFAGASQSTPVIEVHMQGDGDKTVLHRFERIE
jgi:ADP-ribose pyrophosphatase YjhB (NUDIX family)